MEASRDELLSDSLPLFFFFLMMPPPPRSTLFPYTTLFRSRRGGADLHGPERGGVGPPHRARRAHGERDRQITRLDPSHVSISYAVFCVKKERVRWRAQRRGHSYRHVK